MSIDLVAAAFWLQMEPTRKLVLMALCERADLNTGRCWPGRDEIAVRASISVRSVTPHLRALEESGYIASQRRGVARHGETTERRLNVALILQEAVVARDSFKERREALRKAAVISAESQLALGEDASPNENDQGKLTATLGEVAATLGEVGEMIRGSCFADRTVIEPSEEPSGTQERARAQRVGAQERGRDHAREGKPPQPTSSALDATETMVRDWLEKTGHVPPASSVSRRKEYERIASSLAVRGPPA